MRNLLNILGVILFSIIIVSCSTNENKEYNENNESSDKQEKIKSINDGNFERGVMSSNTSSTIESVAISYTFDRKTKTVTEIVFKDLYCREKSYGYTELLKLADKQNIIFKASKISVDNRNNEFDRLVSGELYFSNGGKMQGTLLYHVKGNNKGSTQLLGSIILSSDNFKKSSSDVTLYLKGKSK